MRTMQIYTNLHAAIEESPVTTTPTRTTLTTSSTVNKRANRFNDNIRNTRISMFYDTVPSIFLFILLSLISTTFTIAKTLRRTAFVISPITSTNRPFQSTDNNNNNNQQYVTDVTQHQQQIETYKNTRITTTRRRSYNKNIIRLYGSSNKLWDRLQIEDDEETRWYLLNCVATNEIDLLNQCRTVTQDFSYNDVEKFVIPIEYKTRSHGPKKMLTEVKVKYPGYVFTKLRLSSITYEVIQNLDLCRSWMGTINHKGYKKLPPTPLALNEIEIENFGLDTIDPEENWNALIGSLSAGTSSADSSTGTETGTDMNIINDDADDEDDIQSSKVDSTTLDELYNDPMYKNVNKNDLKQYNGLKVGDYVKVYNTKNKYYNEDGIIRRLKDNKIFIRFYTYGTMFEDWIIPNDIRKLTDNEINNGLSGPSQPITQQEFEITNNINTGTSTSSRYDTNNPRDIRGAFTGGSTSTTGSRNRRQDRVAEQYNSNRDQRYGQSNEYDRRQDEKNWNWYKEQRGTSSNSNDRRQTVSDDKWTMNSSGGTDNYNNENDDPNSNNNNRQTVDHVSARQQRRQYTTTTTNTNQRQGQGQDRRQSQSQSQSSTNFRKVAASVDSMDDWSAFVSPIINTGTSIGTGLGSNDNALSSSASASTSSSSIADDFFSSLVSDLSKDFTKNSNNNNNNNNNYNTNESTRYDNNARQQQQQQRPPRTNDNNREQRSQNNNNNNNKKDDDFFSSLLSELSSSDDSSATRTNSKQKQTDNEQKNSNNSADDDFFASLLSDMSSDDNNSPQQQQQQRERANNDVPKATSTTPRPNKNVIIQPTTTTTTNNNNAGGDLSERTVPDLKDMLRERGLKVSGKKSELIDRLMESSLRK